MARFSTSGLVGLCVMIGMGLIIYLRLWNVEADLDLNAAGVDRIEFERVHNEALDEAAEWRKKYDTEADKSSEYFQKLLEVTQTVEDKNRRLESLETRLTLLQKENHGLLKEVASLKQELEEQKMRCEKMVVKEVKTDAMKMNLKMQATDMPVHVLYKNDITLARNVLSLSNLLCF